jgi:hypothetical protein
MARLVKIESSGGLWSGLCVFGSCVFLGLYLHELQKYSSQSGRGRKIGIVKEMDQDVQRRPNDRLLWLEVFPNKPVFEFDTIKTGPESTAAITLDGGQGDLKLSPNSLVVLDTSEGGVEIRLASGNLFLRGKAKTKVGNKIVNTTQTSEIQIARQAESNQVSIDVGKGQATVESSDGKTELSSGKQFIQESNQQPQILVLPLKITLPENASTLRIAKGEKILFRLGETTSPPSSRILELSNSPQFAKPVRHFSWSAQESSLSVNLPKGSWYARVKDEVSKTLVSPVIQFTVKNQPILSWQGDRESLFNGVLKNNDAEFSISWQAVEDASEYQLAVSLQGQNILTQTFTGNRLQFSSKEQKLLPLLQKNSSWTGKEPVDLTLQAFDVNHRVLGIPISGRLVFGDGRIAPAPEQISVAVSSSDSQKGSVKWTVPATSDSLNFELKLDDQIYQSNQKEWITESVKLYSAKQGLEVRSVGSNGTRSDWKKITYDRSPFEWAWLQNQKSRLVYPLPDSRILQKSLNKTEVEWRLPETEFLKSDQTEIILSRLDKKTKDLVLKTSKNKIPLPKLDPGKYRVEVRPIWGKNGSAAASDTREFSVIKGAGLRAPSLRGPAGE